MRWEALFEDLEGQFAAATEAEFAGEVASVAQAERAAITLASRVAASRDCDVVIRTRGGDRFAGTVEDSADQWLLIAGGSTQTIVPLAAIVSVAGLSDRASEGGGVRRRLGLGHVLRGLADAQAPVRLSVGGTTVPAQVGPVGADIVDIVSEGKREAVAIAAIDAISSARVLRG